MKYEIMLDCFVPDSIDLSTERGRVGFWVGVGVTVALQRDPIAVNGLGICLHADPIYTPTEDDIRGVAGTCCVNWLELVAPNLALRLYAGIGCAYLDIRGDGPVWHVTTTGVGAPGFAERDRYMLARVEMLREGEAETIAQLAKLREHLGHACA